MTLSRLQALLVAVAVVTLVGGLAAAGAVGADRLLQRGDHQNVVPNVTRDGGSAPTAMPSPQSLERVTLTVHDGDRSREIEVQVADEPSERRVGLMWVEELPRDEGMLFVYTSDHSGAFWMRNTRIPLDIAYLDADGVVLEVHRGEPLDETPIEPGQRYRHALEMNAGWFEEHGFGAGSRVDIPADVAE